jgi:hypothetical protein
MYYLSQVPASISFHGEMVQKDAEATVTSILIPIAGKHQVQVTLER